MPTNSANLAAARTVLTGANDFLQLHPTNMDVLRKYIGESGSSEQIREALSVPLLDEVAFSLFREDSEDKTRLRKVLLNRKNQKVQHKIVKDLRSAQSDIAFSNHRAAITVVKLLPAAAMVEKNQVLLVALARFMSSQNGAMFNNAVGQIDLFREVMEEYEQLVFDREQIARIKIAEVHRSLARRAIAVQERALAAEPVALVDLRDSVLPPAPPPPLVSQHRISRSKEAPSKSRGLGLERDFGRK